MIDLPSFRKIRNYETRNFIQTLSQAQDYVNDEATGQVGLSPYLYRKAIQRPKKRGIEIESVKIEAAQDPFWKDILIPPSHQELGHWQFSYNPRGINNPPS